MPGLGVKVPHAEGYGKKKATGCQHAGCHVICVRLLQAARPLGLDIAEKVQ